jgi:hypothetical protein
MFRGSRLALAVVLIATVAGTASANAQYKPTGDDGIAASPKVRQQLNERSARFAPVVAVQPTMACPKCKDTWIKQANTDPKGSGVRALTGKTTKLVAQHLCGGCGTDWSVAGTGKARQHVASHKCTACGAENLACCSPKGSSTVATRGMQQPIQVAPLK